MGDASRLVKAMQKVAQPNENDVDDIVVGKVTSVSPIKIKLDKIELTQSFLILSPFCSAAYTSIEVEEHGVYTVPMWRGLQVGDTVYMLKCGRGQRYYVLQRKEGIR